MAGVQSAAAVRVAELVATLSLAADLGLGQPMAHCMRQTVLALRVARRVGAGESELVATYYTGLLRNVYCHADAYEQAKWFGDDIALKAYSYEEGADSVFAVLKLVGSGERGLARAGRIVSFPISGIKEIRAFLLTHSTLASQFAGRIGLDELACESLRTAYERWDGKGEPNRLKGDRIPLPSRLVTLTASAEVYNRLGGARRARELVRRQRGRELDPALADLFVAEADELLDGLEEAAAWEAIIDAEPRLGRVVAGAELDEVLEAMADLVDLKSPHLAGHSRGVANLAAEAARLAGLPPDEQRLIRRAGLVHDLGRLGVSNAIWDKPGPLSASELERVRLHPYLTDRMLTRVEALACVREVAARNHERLDGSGYPRGLAGGSLTYADRLLATADVYHALTEWRPHRRARATAEAGDELRSQARAGRLDGEAVNAVLRAAGHRAPARREWPAGLTAREVEVLGLLARGHSNKEIAQRLVVTPKTVSNHVEHIYGKIAVSTRAAAALFAMQHGLVGSFEAAS
ncbi:MAG TPA: HD domain-containing phosphohydrolase [Gaiellaceae bacterium]|nr:HD domain-containing phosphohydrolase [Gaiellaceae bacterium]